MTETCPYHRWAPVDRLPRIIGILFRLQNKLHLSFTRAAVLDEEVCNHREDANQRAEKILDVYGNHILRLAYSYLHNMSDAEEVLQDTLIQFLKSLPEFENDRHEKAWLLRVAVNLSKNRIRYNKLRYTDELQETLEKDNNENLSFVWEAVKLLPPHYREVIHHFYYEGYPTAQIAEILHRKESSVRSDLRRGRMKLKEILKGAYDFEEIL